MRPVKLCTEAQFSAVPITRFPRFGNVVVVGTFPRPCSPVLYVNEKGICFRLYTDLLRTRLYRLRKKPPCRPGS